jgi:hypothetical protein
MTARRVSRMAGKSAEVPGPAQWNRPVAARLHRVSTCKVDDLVRALGASRNATGPLGRQPEGAMRQGLRSSRSRSGLQPSHPGRAGWRG